MWKEEGKEFEVNKIHFNQITVHNTITDFVFGMYSYLGMVMHACSPSVWEEEESEVQWDHKKH